jgi:hypothetical protein
MELFCFASRSLENIARGIEHELWAVATVSDSAMRGRQTKARKYLHPGDAGLLYCNPTHSFTTPFYVNSAADPERVVTDVWQEPWSLPFSITPLGNLTRQLPHEIAKQRWSIEIERLRIYKSATAALNITGATVFVPTEISEEAWQMILADLATGA